MTGSGSNALLLGDAADIEMRPVVDFLSQCPAVGRLRRATRLSDARRLTSDATSAIDLVVVLQGWSDEFPAAEIRELLTLFPLARMVCCAGVWCDSDGRSRDLWPGGSRTRIELAIARIGRELALLGACESDGFAKPAPLAPLPLSASRAEAFEYDFSAVVRRLPTGIRVAIESPDKALREMLCSIFRSAGASVSDATGQPGAAVTIWDADPWSDARRAELRNLRAVAAEAPVVACVGFPRPDLVARLLECGAARTWFKLAPLKELFAAVTGSLDDGDG